MGPPPMHAVRLHGPRALLYEDYPELSGPTAGEVLIRVGAVGVCGSDLHLYETGTIGNREVGQPFVPGHEFMGTVLEAGAEALDGLGQPLHAGQRVAIDPQVPCRRCEWCEAGHTNLCPHHTFFGLPGLDGALREKMVVPARNCFPMPGSISDGAGAVLETLGVALHALDLAKGRFGRSAAVVGCGPVGLLIVRLAHLAGLAPLIAIDPLKWRAQKAADWGATHVIAADAEHAAAEIRALTRGRGVDLVFEAAWAGAAVAACAEFACPAGRLVLVGIPADDDFRLAHSVARRKGLTLLFARRMKHVYSRAIALADGPHPRVNLDELITHSFALADTPRAFALNAKYGDGILKAVVQPS